MPLFQKHLFIFKNLSLNLLIVVLYVLLAKIGYFFAIKPTVITIFWPAGGFALGVLLVGGLKYLPGIFIAEIIAGCLVLDNPWMVIGLAIANLTESFFAYWILTKRLNFSSALKTRQDFIKLVLLAAGNACLISAIIGTTVLSVSMSEPANPYLTSFLSWWMAHMLGIAFITPVMLIWKKPPKWSVSKLNICEIFIIYALTLLAGQLLFFDWPLVIDYDNPVDLWLILLIIWAGLRSGRYNTSLLQLILFTELLYSAHYGLGHYANGMLKAGFFDIWLFGQILTAGGLYIAVIADENKKIQEKLRSTNFYQRALLDNFPFAVWLKDTDSRFLSVNKGFADILASKSTKIWWVKMILTLHLLIWPNPTGQTTTRYCSLIRI